MLFLVQDSDRPLYVVADNWQQAVEKWKYTIAGENDENIRQVSEPDGVQKLADDHELVIGYRLEIHNKKATQRS